MRILILYQSPWWNAAAYYTFNLVLSLKRLGYEVTFIAKEKTPIADKMSSINVKLVYLNLFENNPIKFVSNINKVKQIIFDEKINYLIPVSAPGHIIVGIIKKIFHIKLPIIKVCLDNVSPTKNILNKYLHNKLTDYFIFPGTSTKIKYDYFNINNFVILHAPIDLKSFIDYKPSTETLKRKYQLPEHKLIVSFIGRFSPEKGLFFLLDIINEVVKKTNRAYFVLSGSEEQIKYQDVQNKINELGISENVKIINKVTDVRELISITNIGLLSSRYSEYICRIAMEFMSFKVPIVAPRVNVIPEVVGNEANGFVYEISDFHQAAEFILKLVNDESLLKQMGNNSQRRIDANYDVQIFDGKIKDILDTLNKDLDSTK